MKSRKNLQCTLLIFILTAIMADGFSQRNLVIRPVEIDDVLINPGIGFMTFQRFNGDDLNEGAGWTEGYPIEYKPFDGNLENKDHPMTSIAYFRVYWRYLEEEQGKYNWPMIDFALKIARERKQTLLLRIAPYGGGENDVPDWYRKMVGDAEPIRPKWRVDPEDPQYAQYFGRFITELGKRYDGHPDLEAVDLSIVGFWGEGDGSALLTQKTREALVNSYTDNFKTTPLIMLLTDEKTNKYGLSRANVGWRVDCIGDLGFWGTEWTHMHDYYPQGIINFGMKDAWKTAPVSLEVCGTLLSWYGEKGTCKYCQGYTVEDVKDIINETLKWHISSFNAKSSGVPPEWKHLIDDWLKKMGYRYVLRSFSFPETVAPNQKLLFKSWWDNKGVAPCYKNFLLAVRIKNKNRTEIFITDADITTWLPGDNVYDDAVFIPPDMPSGEYDLQIGIVDPTSHEPKVNLAIEGRDSEGWYQIGRIKIK